MSDRAGNRLVQQSSKAQSCRGALIAVLSLFSLLLLPLIIFEPTTSYVYLDDAVLTHLPQVNYFISHPFDLGDYPATAAMTPGYHLFLAWLSILLGYSSVDHTTWFIQVVNATMAYGVLLMSWFVLRRLGLDHCKAAALIVPLACSNYVISSARWLSTDNGALVFYEMVLYVFLFARQKAWLVAASGVLLVLWRQVYFPVLGIYALASASLGRKIKRHDVLVAASAIIPAALVVGYFYATWGGLTPPRYRYLSGTAVNPHVFLHSLALMGLLTVPYGFTFWRVTVSLDRRKLIACTGVVLAVLLGAWLTTPTAYDHDAGRWGSMVWLLVSHLPTIGARSPLLLFLSFVGAAALKIMFLHAHARRYFPAVAGMLLLYFLAYSAQLMAWQRYMEPVIMLTLGVFCAQVGEIARRELYGPVLMAAVFGAMSLARQYGLVGQVFN